MMLAVRIFYEVATENGFIQSVPKDKAVGCWNWTH